MLRLEVRQVVTVQLDPGTLAFSAAAEGPRDTKCLGISSPDPSFKAHCQSSRVGLVHFDPETKKRLQGGASICWASLLASPALVFLPLVTLSSLRMKAAASACSHHMQRSENLKGVDVLRTCDGSSGQTLVKFKIRDTRSRRCGIGIPEERLARESCRR